MRFFSEILEIEKELYGFMRKAIRFFEVSQPCFSDPFFASFHERKAILLFVGKGIIKV
jgi:hypothetical protein